MNLILHPSIGLPRLQQSLFAQQTQNFWRPAERTAVHCLAVFCSAAFKSNEKRVKQDLSYTKTELFLIDMHCLQCCSCAQAPATIPNDQPANCRSYDQSEPILVCLRLHLHAPPCVYCFSFFTSQHLPFTVSLQESQMHFIILNIFAATLDLA